jgi:SAM-dependent methyltransferase
MNSPAKDAQRRYLDCFTPEEQAWGFRKPWSDAECGGYLADVAAVMTLLPPPPGRLLDLGCGMGWTSCMFARRGYEVVGVDLAENMIAMANRKKAVEQLDNVTFACVDFESSPDQFGRFDCAVFYDSLHHSDDERLALAAVYRALKPGAVCITVEPGVGHSKSAEAEDAVRRTGVNERDMEPTRVISAAQRAGFSAWRVYPRGRAMHSYVYGRPRQGPMWKRLRSLMGAVIDLGWFVLRGHRADGLVVLTK